VEKPGSIEESWKLHQHAVFNFFRRMGVMPADAADLSQETFLRAMRGARRYRGDGSVRAWVIGIARNVLREWLRRKGRAEVAFADLPEPEQVQSGHDRASIEGVLASIDHDLREVLVMRFVLDLSSRDTAVALGISDDAVRQGVVRARAAFTAAWEDSDG
jgi:RNA polymerase sigma-70 factor (ECF subfamily)